MSWGFGGKALGEIYGDCEAETNAEDGGDTKGELQGDDSIELFMFGDGKSEVEMSLSLQLPGCCVEQEVEVLMVRPVPFGVSLALPDVNTCSAMAI